jgi:hypothetical protein
MKELVTIRESGKEMAWDEILEYGLFNDSEAAEAAIIEIGKEGLYVYTVQVETLYNFAKPKDIIQSYAIGGGEKINELKKELLKLSVEEILNA